MKNYNKLSRKFNLNNISWVLLFFVTSCVGNQNKKESGDEKYENEITSEPSVVSSVQVRPLLKDFQRQRIKLGHAVNTSANEYYPNCNADGTKLYFSAMDRTGYFDFKLDFIKEKSAGGEDIFLTTLQEGIWTDAKPLTEINTNGHEVVTQIFNSGDLLLTANYPEKLGPKKEIDAGKQTTDLFFLKNNKSGYQIYHLPEPVNSIFTEADGWMADDQSYILFVSDRPGHVGDYHKKGWKWNESFWGNTDVYVSIKEGDYWSIAINLGSEINTPFAERTPWLSYDGLTLYLSSNGYVKGKTDLDVYAYKRKSTNDWTNWDGPFEVEDANTPFDDWGYRETLSGDAFVASANKLNFKPTQGSTAGDGGLRETNYRPGYEVHGLQIAALNSEFVANIYHLQNDGKPSFTLNDLFFDFDSYTIKNSFEHYLLLLVDQINQNKEIEIEINGHTDNKGKAEYNQALSLKRANAIKLFLVSNGVTNHIVTSGFGDSQPTFPNTTDENRSKNRRVEIFFKPTMNN